MRQSFGEEAAGKVEEALEPVHLPLASPRDALGISVRTQLAFLDADDKVVKHQAATRKRRPVRAAKRWKVMSIASPATRSALCWVKLPAVRTRTRRSPR